MYQTEPIQGIHSGQDWTQGHAGEQYCDPALAAASGFHDAFPGPFSNACHTIGNDQMMSRQDSIGAHSVGTNHSSGSYYNQVHAVSMYSTLSQASYPMSPSRSDGSPRSDGLDYTPTPQTGNFLEDYPFNGDGVTYGSKNIGTSMQAHILTEDPMMANFIHEDAFYTPFVHDPEIITNGSPALFDNNYETLSQPALDETWLPAPQMRSPAASSSSHDSNSCMTYLLDGSNVPSSVSRPTKKTAPRQSKVISDFARNTQQFGASDISQDFVKYTSGRSMDSENHARDHELYHNAAPHPDGLYHCPWEGQDCCQHRPEKLKCNYEYDHTPTFAIGDLDRN